MGGAVVVGLTMSRRGYKILRDGQMPAVGEKVFRPTRIKRGASARLAGYAYLLAFTPFVVLALWGHGQAAALSSKHDRVDQAACKRNSVTAGAGIVVES